MLCYEDFSTVTIIVFIATAAKYTECAVLTYGSGVCSLHANYSRSYSLAPSVGHIADRSRFTFEKIESPTSAKKCSIHTHLDVTARASFKSCLTSSYIANKKLPSLAIVMSVTDDWTQSHRAGFDAVTSNFDCYCKLHNYTFVSAIFSIYYCTIQ